jgi:hypothetical protein
LYPLSKLLLLLRSRRYDYTKHNSSGWPWRLAVHMSGKFRPHFTSAHVSGNIAQNNLDWREFRVRLPCLYGDDSKFLVFMEKEENGLSTQFCVSAAHDGGSSRVASFTRPIDMVYPCFDLQLAVVFVQRG